MLQESCGATTDTQVSTLSSTLTIVMSLGMRPQHERSSPGIAVLIRPMDPGLLSAAGAWPSARLCGFLACQHPAGGYYY